VKKLTTNEFIEKAKIIHDNRYDYSKTIYINAHNKIIVICPEHGEFYPIANNHIIGKGCRQCWFDSRIKISTVFINEARAIHGDKYDYSKIIYSRNNKNIEIICPVHGSFWQSPSNHLKTGGCRKCGDISASQTLLFSTKDFIEKANIVHNNKYDYSLVNYTGSHNIVKIICGLHGMFKQQASGHLLGKRCKMCAIESSKLTTDEFIIRANIVHNNKYDYSLTNYNASCKKVIIICHNHSKPAQFTQSASNHLAGSGCPKCGHFVSKSETKWLDSLYIPDKYRHKTIMIDKKRYNVDAFDPIKNIIYEFYGDYWHGNPIKYNQDVLHPSFNGLTYGDIYFNTIKREQDLISQGYRLITIWENDFHSKNS
jgi:hypothetical protein